MSTVQHKSGTLSKLLLAMLMAVAAVLSGCADVTTGDEDVGELSQEVCTAVALAANPPSPQGAGTNVILSVSGGTCGAGETPEYRFVYIREGTTTPVEIRGYSTTPTATWNTVGLPSGAYNVIVYVRAVGTTVASQASTYLNPKYLIGNVCNNTTAFDVSPTPPQAPGTMVSLTSSATCTGGSAEYRYAYRAPGTTAYVFVGPFGPATQTWDTTGLPAGNYSLVVYTRAAGNLSTSESIRYANYLLGSTCSGANGSASPPAPQAQGTTIALSGSATCASPQFRFSYRLSGNTAWIPINPAFGAATQNWDTTGLSSGLYQLLVEARQAGNTGGAESTFVFTYSLGGVCGPVTVATDPPSPQGPGALIELIGNATCTGGATPEYRFSYRPSGVSGYTLIRGYGGATATWNTTGLPVGNYVVQVETRAVGSTSSFEALAVRSFTITSLSLAQISSGLGWHACARANDDTARCWGANESGQLGNGSMSPTSSTPVAVVGLSNVSAVSAGGFHSCALMHDGTVSCWGDNSDGQLGNNSTTSSPTPVQVSGLTDATAVSAGTYHTCALRAAGDVVCWGNNSYLQAGSALSTDYPNALLPVVVPGTAGATALFTGGFHGCALVAGALKCWGDNSLGQLGTGGVPIESATALNVAGLTSGVTAVGSGDGHVCALASGTVRCWGDNTYGQLGIGTASETPVTTPTLVPGLNSVAEIHAGFTYSCALITNRTVRCWGRNGSGELGDGTGVDRYAPGATVAGLNSATSLTTGALTACVTLLSGGAQCWGYGGTGALGNGGLGDAFTPSAVGSP